MKIALIQLAKLGDLLQTSPLLQRLRVLYPAASLHLIHSQMFTSAAQLTGADVLHPLELDMCAKEQGNKGFILQPNQACADFIAGLPHFDLAINLNSNQLSEELLARLHASSSLGHGSHHRQSMLWRLFNMSFIRSRRFSSFNLVDIFMQMVQPGALPHVTPAKSAPAVDGPIVLAPGTRSVKRGWLISNWSELATNLVNSGHQVVFAGSAQDAGLIKKVLDGCPDKDNIKDLSGQTSLSSFTQLLKQAKMLICCDSGPQHVAALSATHTLVLFTGPAYPQETLAWNRHALALVPDLHEFDCYPCQESEPCPWRFWCQAGIKVEDVMAVVNGLAPVQARLYKPVYDNMGQLLLPVQNDLLPHELFSLLWRAFASRFFTGKDYNWSIVAPQFKIDTEHVAKLQADLQRELLITGNVAPAFNFAKDKPPRLELTSPMWWSGRLEYATLGTTSMFKDMRTFLSAQKLTKILS